MATLSYNLAKIIIFTYTVIFVLSYKIESQENRASYFLVVPFKKTISAGLKRMMMLKKQN